MIGLRKAAVFILAILFSSPSFSATFQDCSEEQTSRLEEILPVAVETSENWQLNLRSNYYDPRYSSQQKEISQAYRKLRCAARKIPLLNLHCVKGKSYDASTFPIIGVGVKVNDSFFSNSRDRMVGMIIHEATHKCATNDAAYFNSFGNSPRSTRNSRWSNIADTYEYWAVFGYCIPGIDCAVSQKSIQR